MQIQFKKNFPLTSSANLYGSSGYRTTFVPFELDLSILALGANIPLVGVTLQILQLRLKYYQILYKQFP